MHQMTEHRTGWRGLAGLLCAGWIASAAPMSSVAAPPATQQAAILAYHRFSASGVPDEMTVQAATFEAHLAFLRSHGYRIVPLRDIVAWLRDPSAPLPDKAVALTVDDGHRSVYDVMRPIVLRERIPVTLFVYPSAISNASYAMTWAQLRELHETGWFDVQSHTWWHPNFHVERRKQAPDAFREFALTQFRHSRERIASELGGPVDLIAWPFGLHDPELEALAAQAGYTAAFTLDARQARRGDALLALPRFLMVDACSSACLARLLGENAHTVAAGGARP
ncbi:Polysaccharide deacetylase [Burkholderia multivorans]